MTSQKRIPYQEVKRIIIDCRTPRTQALIAYQYAFGCRAGELAKEYRHEFTNDAGGKIVSDGPRAQDVKIRTNPLGQRELVINKPNFKQKKDKDRQGRMKDIARFESFVNETWEPWLFKVILEWVKGKGLDDHLFNLKQSAIRGFIDAELKHYNPEYSSHHLRHSRAFDIAEITKDPYAVQAILGHGDMRTSMAYVDKLSTSLYDAMRGRQSFEEVLGKGVSVDEKAQVNMTALLISLALGGVIFAVLMLMGVGNGGGISFDIWGLFESDFIQELIVPTVIGAIVGFLLLTKVMERFGWSWV